jgi:hypothetical protein
VIAKRVLPSPLNVRVTVTLVDLDTSGTSDSGGGELVATKGAKKEVATAERQTVKAKNFDVTSDYENPQGLVKYHKLKYYKFEEDNPFIEDSDDSDEETAAQKKKKADRVASIGYRYRKWDLGNDIKLVARCEHDAVTTGSTGGEHQYINIKALNEWDSRFSGGVDWQHKVDVQPGAVLADELKHNACKLSKALNEWDSRFSGGVDWRQKLNVQPGTVLANELKHNACKLSKALNEWDSRFSGGVDRRQN